MTSSHRLSIALGLLALAPVAPIANAHAHAANFAGPAPFAQTANPERYVLSTKSTKLVNLADKQGLEVAEVPAGTLLAVYGERAGWLSVEPPQGLNVWVYGQFLRATAQTGIAEVTGDGVNMRPKPSSAVESFPLEQKLHEGDRVRVLRREDPKKPLREDWVQIISPPGVRGWIAATDTGPTASGLDTRTAWMDAVKKSSAGVALLDLGTGTTAIATAPATGVGDTALASTTKPDGAPAQGTWDAAESAYDSAKVAPNPDWKSVRAGFERYLAQNPSGANASTAKLRLEQITYHQEIQRLKSDAALQDQQRQAMVAEAQAQLDEAALAQDPLWGRFQARGWLQRDPKHANVFTLQWSGRTVAEITCGSGRYNLGLFVGAEVGVIGATTRSASGADRPIRVDASRIEILSAPTVP